MPAVSDQGLLDFFEILGPLEKILESAKNSNKSGLSDVSYIAKASLKLDFYPVQKVHGKGTERGTRLIFGSCYVANTMPW